MLKRRQTLKLLGGSALFLALGQTALAQGRNPSFSVVLTGREVVPNPVETQALAVVRVELMGRTLVIQGAVANLAGPFRDYTKDPVDDLALNARLISAVHLHRGPKGTNGPLLQALKVQPAPDGRSGTFVDRVELGLEDLLRLRRGELYFDIHTSAFRGGEVRGQILL